MAASQAEKCFYGLSLHDPTNSVKVLKEDTKLSIGCIKGVLVFQVLELRCNKNPLCLQSIRQFVINFGEMNNYQLKQAESASGPAHDVVDDKSCDDDDDHGDDHSDGDL